MTFKNLAISDINCALAISQLERIEYFLNSRKKIYEYYLKYLYNDNNFLKIKYNKNNLSAYHLFLLKLKDNFAKKKIKNSLIKYMLNKGIKCQYHYIPIYKFKIYKDKINLLDFKGAEKFYSSTFSIPIFVDLTKINQKSIIKNLNNYFKK